MDNQVMDNNSENNQTHVEPVSQEKLVPQSQVNEIVGHAKREAAARAVEAYKSQQVQAATPAYEPQANRHMSEDDIKRLTGDEIKRHFSQIQEESMERANQDAANRIVNQ